jgi:hypothetical protein
MAGVFVLTFSSDTEYMHSLGLGLRARELHLKVSCDAAGRCTGTIAVPRHRCFDMDSH